MDTVDNKFREVAEARWCDHISAGPLWAIEGRILRIDSKPIFLVIDEGNLNLLCPVCLVKVMHRVLPYKSLSH